MTEQNYQNHHRHISLHTSVLFGLIVITLIGSCVNLIASLGNHQRIYSASLLVAVCLILLLMFIAMQVRAAKAQRRAIRAEENLRHFVLAGSRLDSRLSLHQISGLRFASDEEFVALARRAVEEGLSEDDIKRAVKHWRADIDNV